MITVEYNSSTGIKIKVPIETEYLRKFIVNDKKYFIPRELDEPRIDLVKGKDLTENDIAKLFAFKQL